MNNRDSNDLLQDQEAVEILKFLLEIGYTKEQVVSGLQELEARTNERAD